MSLLDTLRSAGLTVRADGERLAVSPRELLTDELRRLVREHKREILEALAAQAQVDDDALARLYAELFEGHEARALVTLEVGQVRRAMACGAVPADTARSAVLLAYRAIGGERCIVAIPRARYDGIAVLGAFATGG